MACAGGRHRLGHVEAARDDGGKQQVDPAGNRHLRLTGAQTLAGQVDRDQGGGAGGVDGQRGTLQIKEIRQPVGDDAQRATGSAPCFDLADVPGGHEPVLADARADEDTGLRALQGPGRDAGLFECFDGHLEHQALLRIDVVGLTRGDAEEFGVEARDIGQERAPSRGVRQRLRCGRGSVVESLPPVIGHSGHCATPLCQEVEEFVRSVDVSREPAT